MRLQSKTWEIVPIEDILAPIFNGKTIQQGWSPRCERFPAESEEKWGVLKTTAIQRNIFLPEQNKQLPKHLRPRPNLEVRSGDILMTCAGPRSRCGVTCMVVKTRPLMMMSGKMYRFRPFSNLIDSRFVMYFLHCREAEMQIDNMKTGISDSGLNLTHDRFKKLPIPIPPLNEQRRIVEKIEALFSELDKGIESLKTAREQLKVYRQALLKHAFEGKLTEQWRKDNADKLESPEQLLNRIKQEREARHRKQMQDWQEAVRQWEAEGKKGRKPAKPKKLKEFREMHMEDMLNLPEIPSYWIWIYLNNAVDKIQIGPFGSLLHKHDYVSNGFPLINPSHIKNMEIFPDSNLSVTNEKIRGLAGYVMQLGDIVVGRRGEMGRCAVIGTKENGWLCGTGSLFVRLLPSFNSYFYCYILSSQRVRDYLSEFSIGTTMSNLNQKILEYIPVPICSRFEQDTIIDFLKDKFSLIDHSLDEINKCILSTEALCQSILKKAFSGRLVPQDPNDEPASELLKRIAAEKAALEAKAKAARKKVKRVRGRKKG